MEFIVNQLLKEIDKVREIDVVNKITGAPYALITDKMQSDIRLAEQALANR